MRKGIELIKEERREQIEKHGFSLEKDAKYYQNGELGEAAMFCKNLVQLKIGTLDREFHKWPDGWSKHFEEKIRNKNIIGQLTVCGAFCLAEYERGGDDSWKTRAGYIGVAIDDLIAVLQ